MRRGRFRAGRSAQAAGCRTPQAADGQGAATWTRWQTSCCAPTSKISPPETGKLALRNSGFDVRALYGASTTTTGTPSERCPWGWCGRVAGRMVGSPTSTGSPPGAASSSTRRDAMRRWRPTLSSLRSFDFGALPRPAPDSRTTREPSCRRSCSTTRRRPIEQLVELRPDVRTGCAAPNRSADSSVVDESVLFRVVGGPDVMAAQMRHLLVSDGSCRTWVVPVLPFTAGLPTGAHGPLHVAGDSG